MFEVATSTTMQASNKIVLDDHHREHLPVATPIMFSFTRSSPAPSSTSKPRAAEARLAEPLMLLRCTSSLPLESR